MKEYTLKDFKVSDFKDNYGNTWCDAVFEELGEPVKWVVKDPESIVLGTSYYGEVKEMMSKQNKPYQRFYRHERPDDHQTSANADRKTKEDYEPGTNARWAIGMAYRGYLQVMGSPPEGQSAVSDDTVWVGIEAEARRLVDMFERIKTGEQAKAPIHDKLAKGFTKPANDDEPPYDERGMP